MIYLPDIGQYIIDIYKGNKKFYSRHHFFSQNNIHTFRNLLIKSDRRWHKRTFLRLAQQKKCDKNDYQFILSRMPSYSKTTRNLTALRGIASRYWYQYYSEGRPLPIWLRNKRNSKKPFSEWNFTTVSDYDVIFYENDSFII